MTALPAIHTTLLERALLAIAVGVERAVAERAARRAIVPAPTLRHVDARADAQALGGIGIMPR